VRALDLPSATPEDATIDTVGGTGSGGSDYRCCALLLDFNGVLTSDLFAAYRAFCIANGFAGNALFNLLTDDPDGHDLLVGLETGRIAQPQFEHSVGRLLGIDGTGMIAAITGQLGSETQLLDFASQLRHFDVKTGVVSNSLGLQPFNPYESWQLAQRFDTVVLSGEVGFRKPEPDIFLLSAERLGVPCGQCVFVDDMIQNLEPARALGMMTVHHTSAETTIHKLRHLFAHVLSGRTP
jgi:epoxide hydrolase-like predicted phosphatase